MPTGFPIAQMREGMSYEVSCSLNLGETALDQAHRSQVAVVVRVAARLPVAVRCSSVEVLVVVGSE